MDYEKSVSFRGDPRKALELAQNVFAQNGFKIRAAGATTLEVENTAMPGKNANSIVGASEATVTATRGSLTVSASFGGVRKMRTFLVALIGGLGAMLLLLSGIFSLFGIAKPHGPLIELAPTAPWPVLIPLGALAPWPVLIPLMVAHRKKQAARALDTLLENMAAVGTEH